MTRFEGEKLFPLTPAELWGKLTDARFLVACLPDVESVAEIDADHAVLVIKPGFAFVRGKLDANLQVSEKAAPNSAKLVLASKGIGSSSRVEISINIDAHVHGSKLHWAAAIVELGGLLKLVPAGLIQGAAQSLFGDVLARVEKQLANPAEPNDR